MKWTPEAEAHIKKVPFFVRKKVKKKVEAFVLESGADTVEVVHIKAAKKQFVATMKDDIKGFQVENCFSSSGCPNRINPCDSLVGGIETVLNGKKIKAFLKENVPGDLKYHHEFRVSTADCPNACSQPQIKDVGVLGAVRPFVTGEACSGCNACVEICPDKAVFMTGDPEKPEIDETLCLMCAKCITACPTGTITQGKTGFRVQLGGRLGRRPRLAMELPGIYSGEDVLQILERTVDFYKKKSLGGKRFSHILRPSDIKSLTSGIQPG